MIRRYLRYITVSIVLLLTTHANAQDTLVQTTNFDLRSPYHTVLFHLQNLQEDRYIPEKAALTMHVEGDEDAEELAVKLMQVYNAKGLYIDLAVIPKNGNYIDSISGLNRYYLFDDIPEIYVERIGKKWLYSKRTAQNIPVLHKEIFPFGSDLLIKIIPKFGHKKLLGLAIWQQLGILIIILFSFIIHRLLSFIFRLFIKRFTNNFTTKNEKELIMRIAGPLSLLFITLLLIILVPILQLPIRISKYLVMIIQALTPFFGTVFFYRFVDLISVYFEKLAAKTKSTLDDQLIPLVKKTIKVFIVLTGSLLILNNLNFNVTAILAGLSIGGLALALAAQDTIKNFFGSLMIFIDKPFQIGDYIQFEGIYGTVEEVGFRSTRVRTFANSLVYIPNGKISDLTVDNLGMRIYRRFTTDLSIQYDTPTMLIEEFVEGLRKIVVLHPDTRKDYYEVHLNSMGDSSINVLFYIFFEVPDWSAELKARHEVILSILKLAEKIGVNFAFPTQTLHVENFPEKNSGSATYLSDRKEVKARVEGFLKELKS